MGSKVSLLIPENVPKKICNAKQIGWRNKDVLQYASIGEDRNDCLVAFMFLLGAVAASIEPWRNKIAYPLAIEIHRFRFGQWQKAFQPK
jgi:hypothetical protein